MNFETQNYLAGLISLLLGVCVGKVSGAAFWEALVLGVCLSIWVRIYCFATIEEEKEKEGTLH